MVALLSSGSGYSGYPDTPKFEENNNTYNTFHKTEEIIRL
jgi:hypothetical protein